MVPRRGSVYASPDRGQGYARTADSQRYAVGCVVTDGLDRGYRGWTGPGGGSGEFHGVVSGPVGLPGKGNRSEKGDGCLARSRDRAARCRGHSVMWDHDGDGGDPCARADAGNGSPLFDSKLRDELVADAAFLGLPVRQPSRGRHRGRVLSGLRGFADRTRGRDERQQHESEKRGDSRDPW